jgi:hypothetical protein
MAVPAGLASHRKQEHGDRVRFCVAAVAIAQAHGHVGEWKAGGS